MGKIWILMVTSTKVYTKCKFSIGNLRKVSNSKRAKNRMLLKWFTFQLLWFQRIIEAKSLFWADFLNDSVKFLRSSTFVYRTIHNCDRKIKSRFFRNSLRIQLKIPVGKAANFAQCCLGIGQETGHSLTTTLIFMQTFELIIYHTFFCKLG